ncbi:MAG: hypothetical protein JNJ71_07380 [Rubrivivax sp.]|nr:hypothetical protein [Rubrivivax sp.]
MKLTPILQSEASECAIASPAMVAAAHGQHHDLKTLRRSFSTSLKGATLQSLIQDGVGRCAHQR